MADSKVSENQTIVEPWSISSLKAYLEQKIASVETETGLKFESRDLALKHQFDLDQEHFKQLNNEAARLLKNVEITVSRDMWDAFKETDRTWKQKCDAGMLALLPRNEFHTYKETTDRNMNLGAGKWQGALQLVSTIASFAAIVSVVFLWLK